MTPVNSDNFFPTSDGQSISVARAQDAVPAERTDVSTSSKQSNIVANASGKSESHSGLSTHSGLRSYTNHPELHSEDLEESINAMIKVLNP